MADLCVGWIDDRDPILKPDTPQHVGQALEAAQLAPALLHRQRQLEHQAQQGIPGHVVIGSGGARCRMVAKLDSIGLVVRIQTQCSAGKS